MRKSGFEQILAVLPQVLRISDIWIWHFCRVEKRRLDCICLDQLEHAGQQQALQLEATLVVSVCQNKKDILDNAREVRLEEAIADIGIRSCKIIDDLQAHCRGGHQVRSIKMVLDAYNSIQYLRYPA